MLQPRSNPLSSDEQRTAALLRIAAAIETAATLDELLMLGLNEFTQLLGIANSGVILLNETDQTARLVSTSPPRTVLPPPFALHDTLFLAQVVAQREPVQINDVTVELDRPEAKAATRQLLPLLSAEQIRSLLLLPLVAQDRCIGLLLFASVTVPRQFSELEVAQARLLAGQLAAAITSFRITEQAQRRSAELATLNEIAAVVTSSLNTREVYHLVMEKLNEYFRVDAGSLLMLDEDTNELVFVMTLEAGEEKLFGVRVPYGKGIVWSVASSQSYAIVNDVQNDPRFLRTVSDSVGYLVETLLCVPIVVKGRTIGVIELLNKRDGPFNEAEAMRLTRMAATIGVAIENARLFQTVTTVRDRFEAILNSTNDGIIMADMRDSVVTANSEAARLFQLERDQLIGQPLTEVLATLRNAASAVNLPSWLNPEDDEQVVELELDAPARRFIRQYLLPVRETNGAEIGRLALFQDISKERELAQLREDYTGMLVHDLRAPLTAIMNGILMVQRGLGGPISPEQRELLGIAHQGSQSMLEMVNTLLDIARLEQGHMQLERGPVSPYTLVEQTIERLRASAQGQRVALEQMLEANLPTFEADHEKLVRVLQNLLDNAIKFSPSGAVVTLGGMLAQLGASGVARLPQSDLRLPPLQPGEWMIFWVRDHGPGIPPQYHARIFEKFGQVGSGRKVRGTGLGLTFCKLAVEAHGGQIWLQSIEGTGSTFALALPRH
ncbi:MAG: GAF domain-containing protein [Oscillochloridaceae bacterium umkhey_bin13]